MPGVPRVPGAPKVLEAIERGVHRAHGHAAAAARFDFGGYGGAIGVGAEAKERQHHDLLEFAEDGRRDARHGDR